MTHLAWLIYLSGALDNFGMFLVVLLIVGSGIIIVSATCYAISSDFDEDESPRLKIKSFLRLVIPIWVFIGLLACIIPPQKTTLLMASAIYSEKFIQSDQGRAIIDPSIQLLRDWIQAQLKALDKK